MCHQEVQATTADVLISFQQIPGSDSDMIINGGSARVEGSDTPVRPQGDGYYGLRMSTGSTSQLRLFGTDYAVRHVEGDVNEPPHGDDICLTAWDTLGPNDQTCGVGGGMQTGVQRRLQLLGYYTGLVDGNMGKKTEEAILRFQADNGLRSDGVVGPMTRAVLNGAAEDDTVSERTHVIRKSLVRFERAPRRGSPRISHGRPWANAPEPDCRGFVEVSNVGIDLRGPVVTMARETDFRIKLVRECISNSATLIAESNDTDVVEVLSPDPLPGDKYIELRLRAGSLEGSDPSHTSVKIVVRSGSTRTIIASLEVIVLPLIVKDIRPYWVTIDGADHTFDSVAFSGPMAPNGDQELINQALNVTKEILWPYGVKFRRLAWREKEVTLPRAGLIQWADINSQYRTIQQTNDTEGRAAEDDKVNLYIVRRIEGALGVTYSTRRYENWPWAGLVVSSSGNYMNTTAIEIGQTIAHELGHMMALANAFRNPQLSHAEDDPDAAHKKKDIWSLMRLMSGTWSSDPDGRQADAWAQDLGYGNNQGGCMLSVRNNRADRTDDECYNARRHATSSNFYRNP